MTRVKPLKFRFFGFGMHPKCKKHHLHLVYVDEMIGNFTDAVLACFFDKSALPPSELIEEIRVKFPQEIESFMRGWVYSITIGRGAPIVSRYMDGISNGYLKQLSRKQKKALKKEEDRNPNKISKVIKDGLKEITNQYTRLLKHLRVHSEILTEPAKLKSLSKSLQNCLNEWQIYVLKNNRAINSPEAKREMTLKEIKHDYDEILNVCTCRCLLGLNLESREVKKARIGAFDRFSAYLEFYERGLTSKFTKLDVLKHQNIVELKSINGKLGYKKNFDSMSTSESFRQNEMIDNKQVLKKKIATKNFNISNETILEHKNLRSSVLVNHYFKKKKGCKAGKNSTITRHNYELVDKNTLKCINCGHQIENNDNHESRITLSKKQIESLERSKQFGDITIYRVYFSRKLWGDKFIWLKFPGISYVGQTIEHAIRRLNYGHIKNAFNERKKHTYFGKSIKHNFHLKKYAKEYLKLEILQIIRFQGDISKIRAIESPELKKVKLELAMKSTQALADTAERFWIGFYKTQFKEFGRNVHEGGKENRMVLLDPLKLENAIKNIMHLHRKKGPFSIVQKQLKTTRAILTNNLLLYYGKYLKDVKHDLILKETKKLFELGYLAPNIAEILHLEGETENASKTISEWIRNEIYSKRFPDRPPYRRIRDVILSEIITKKAQDSIVSYKSLLQELPGFKVQGRTIRENAWELKRFVVRNLGGIKKLNELYHPKQKKDYYNQALELIKNQGRTYSEFNLALDLGFVEDFNYSKNSLKKNAGRALKKYVGKSMSELRNDVLNKK